MNKQVVVPQTDIDAAEAARLKFWEFIERHFTSDGAMEMHIVVEAMAISEPIWVLTHRKYKEVEG